MTTAEMEIWVRDAGLEWRKPHFVHDIDGIQSWEWWKDDRYMTAAVYPDEPADCSLYAKPDNVTHSETRPLMAEHFVELWRGLLGC